MAKPIHACHAKDFPTGNEQPSATPKTLA